MSDSTTALLLILLPFISSLLTLLLQPIISSAVKRQRETAEIVLDNSSAVKNYTEALNAAWLRIQTLEKRIIELEMELRDHGRT